MADLIKNIIEKYKTDTWWQEAERMIVGKYGKLFHPSNLSKLTKEEFKSFLLIKNNLHWDGIHRQGNLITNNIYNLKKALSVLLDENKNIKERLNFLFPKK